MLVDNASLEGMDVVANSRMNRGRGIDAYSRELGVSLIGFLEYRARTRGQAAWLDLCCGEARALIEAAEQLAHAPTTIQTPPAKTLPQMTVPQMTVPQMTVPQIEIHGVDLVSAFRPVPAGVGGVSVRFHTASVHHDSAHAWAPIRSYDLITCVHGLHYLGDKLGMIARAVGWLVEDGVFVAHLDLDNIRLACGRASARWIPNLLRKQGLSYDRRRVRCTGRKAVRWPLRYLGADPKAGPNHTGQPAVTAHYQWEVGYIL